VSDYIFDNAAAETEARFGALEALFDPVTLRQLEPFVLPGSRCLEVGAGSGSIALWMSDRVGQHGHIVATDINPRFLQALAVPNLEVRRHDIVADPLEENSFDVAHTRLVLLHLPERAQAIKKIIRSLKTGGWVVFQEFEATSLRAKPETYRGEHLLKTLLALQQVITARGANLQFGRELPAALEDFGLGEISAEGYLARCTGGSAWGRLVRANFEQMRDAILASGAVTNEEFEEDLRRLDDPTISWPSQILWSVRGQKP
jgi:ubiquinone/menaquinone biosynthesis C-methylase UbiE